MVTLTKSTQPVKESEIKREWHLIDANNKILGRISTEISDLLQGKNKTNYVTYLDQGDYVVVINARRIGLTGKKSENKIYLRYSGYPGGQKQIAYKKMLEKNPAEIIKHAVSGMLPKNKLRDRRMARLYIFADDKYPYEDKFKK